MERKEKIKQIEEIINSRLPKHRYTNATAKEIVDFMENFTKLTLMDESKRSIASDSSHPSPIMTDSDHEAGKMSLEERKNKISNELFCQNFAGLSLHSKFDVLNKLIAQLYASQLSPDADRYKKLEDAFEELLKEKYKDDNLGEMLKNNWRTKAGLTVNKAE